MPDHHEFDRAAEDFYVVVYAIDAGPNDDYEQDEHDHAAIAAACRKYLAAYILNAPDDDTLDGWTDEQRSWHDTLHHATEQPPDFADGLDEDLADFHRLHGCDRAAGDRGTD